MILKFSVENHRSFRDRVEVSFLSTARKDAPEWRIPFPGARHGVLPVVGAWGANASGKSNLLDALEELRNMVAWSFTRLQPDGALPWHPWRLDEAGDPTEMQLDFTVAADGGAAIRHHYTVAWTARGVAYEALYAWPRGVRRLLYERDADDEEQPFRPGRSLRRAAEVWRATRPNSLFLSAAAQLNHAQLLPVFRTIADGIQVAHIDDAERALRRQPILFDPESPVVDPDNRELVVELLRAADFAVRQLDLRHREDVREAVVDQLKQLPNLSEAERRRFDAIPVPVELRLVHGGDDEDGWICPSEDESDGTKKLLALLNHLFPVLERGGVLLIDELDRSMHPDLCREIIGIFTNPEANPHGAQLLFTTHSRELLDVLRTDEVLLLDRDAAGATSLVAASDYKGLRARDDQALARAHRQGRIGGVPVLLGLGAALAAAAWAAGAGDEE